MKSKHKKYKETKNRKKLKKIRLQKTQLQEKPGLTKKIRDTVRKLLRGRRISALREALNKSVDKKSCLYGAALILLPALLLLITQIITAQSGLALFWGFEHAGAFFLGWFVLLGLCALVCGVSGKLWVTWLLPAVPCIVIALVNHYKMELHGAPLMMNDFTLIGQFGIIAGYAMPNLKVSLATAAALLLAIVLLVGLFLAERGKHISPQMRGICSAVGAVGCALSLFCIPGSALVYQAVGGAATQAERVDSAGVLTGLYCAWAADQSMEPVVDTAALQESVQSAAPPVAEKMPEAVTEEELIQEEEPAPTLTPTVIFLMSESFFDITDIPTLQFETDPIPVFHALEETATSGKFISNTYCGGTGYVEMEVLTGICSYLLKESDTLTSLPFETYDAIPCITDVFDQYGYRKEFIHSHTNELYNRSTIYDSFGFDSIRFSDSFPEDTVLSGGYIPDMALSEEIIAAYEQRGEEPLMLFTVSMENHQPYTAVKYGEPSGAGMTSELLNEEELAIVDSYVSGLMNADRALGYLVEYFSAQEDPVMLVFWGDHLPNLKLPEAATAFEKLQWCSTGTTTDWNAEELQHMLSTDYLIWTNYAPAAEDKLSSSTVLGLDVLEQLGFTLTDYYRWLKGSVMPGYLMYRPRLFVDGDGCASTVIPEEQKTMMDYYSSAIYNMVYGEQNLFAAHRVE